MLLSGVVQMTRVQHRLPDALRREVKKMTRRGTTGRVGCGTGVDEAPVPDADPHRSVFKRSGFRFASGKRVSQRTRSADPQ